MVLTMVLAVISGFSSFRLEGKSFLVRMSAGHARSFGGPSSRDLNGNPKQGTLRIRSSVQGSGKYKEYAYEGPHLPIIFLLYSGGSLFGVRMKKSL